MRAAPAAGPLLLALVMMGAAPVAPALAQSNNPAGASASVKSVADLTRGLQSQPGFIDVWRDAAKGRVLLSVASLEQPFLLLSSLPYALGSVSYTHLTLPTICSV